MASDLQRNESLKLIANWLNSISVAAIAAGLFAPLASRLYGLGPKIDTDTPLTSLAVVCICFGVALHLAARLVLGGLRDDE